MIEPLVNGVALDDVERAIYGAAHVASLTNPSLRPPASIDARVEVEGAPGQPVAALIFAAWAVVQFRTDAGARPPR